MLSHFETVNEQGSSNKSETKAYKLLRKLGSGNYANVYLAEFYNPKNTKNSVQLVACKILDTAKLPPEYTHKFVPRELEILKRVNHPHIIQIFSMYQKNTKYLIFMRFAEKGDLLEFIQKYGSIQENQTRLWIKQIALAIQYLHELEITHRDLKCENILITDNLNVKLSDFGFAKYVVTKTGVTTLSTTYCGSVSYSAPEIVKGIPYNPKISDIWSLGVIIFVMLNKGFPFTSTSLKALYEQQINKKWKFKPQIEATASKEVKELLSHLLEPKIEERHTINEVLSSSWMQMDFSIVGMNQEESHALMSARKERAEMEKNFKS